jgi:hypothetical protein
LIFEKGIKLKVWPCGTIPENKNEEKKTGVSIQNAWRNSVPEG